MRAAVLTGLLLLPTSAALAAPSSIPESHLTLPSQETLTARYAFARANADATLPDLTDEHVHYQSADPRFGFGPLRADGEDAYGLGRRHAPRPRYRLEGVSVLGGSVGGSIDGRGAMLNLHWAGNN